MIYSQNLKKIRAENNLTQKDLASILGIERGTYAEYEIEYTIMPIKYLNQLCNYFNISLDYLLNFTDIKQYSNSNPEINTTISSKHIKEFRRENNLTQIKLAQNLNTAKTTISGYERGARIIATPFLYEICSKYKISADYLIGKTNEPKYIKK